MVEGHLGHQDISTQIGQRAAPSTVRHLYYKKKLLKDFFFAQNKVDVFHLDPNY